MSNKFNHFWKDINKDLNESEPPEDLLLKTKGDQLHVFILLIIFIYAVLFTTANIIFDSYEEAIVTFFPAPIVIGFYYLLFKRKKTLTSKILTVFLILLMLVFLSLLNSKETGVLTFFIPVVVGVLITFQGNEMKYGILLTVFSFGVMIFLLFTDYQIGDNIKYTEAKLLTEQIQNYIGSAFATVFSVRYLLFVSNKLQSNLLTTRNQLEKKNNSLSELLDSNFKKTKQISEQLEQIRQSDIELKKLSLIATKTKNAVVITNSLGKIEWVNQAFEDITGWKIEEVTGKKPKDFLLRTAHQDEVSAYISAKLKEKEFVKATLSNYTKEGVLYYNEIEISPIFDETGAHTNFISIQRDITTEIKAKNEIEQLNERYALVVNKVTQDMIWEFEFNLDLEEKAIDILSLNGRKFNEKENNIKWNINYLNDRDSISLIEKIDLSLLNKIDKWEYEYAYQNENERKIFLERGYIIFDQQFRPIRMLGAISDVTEQRKLEESLVEQKLQQQKLIAQIAIQAQEKEKNFVATELHENINQILAVAKMQLDFSSGNDESIKKSNKNIELALQEIRKLSHALASPMLMEYNLIEALDDLINDTASISNAKIKFKKNLNLKLKIPDEINITIYRVIQEQLNNIIKHAKASQIILQISSDEKGIDFSIEDDGIGFDRSKINVGLGLKSIEGRIKLYAGIMNIETEPQKGCKLHLHIPINNLA